MTPPASTSPEAFTAGRAFMTPAFRLELNGQDTGREVISDILEVSFTDDLDNIDSFEFLLHDWDPVALRPRYSSPWNESGAPYKLYEGGPDIPNFEPGTKVSLYLGYLEDGALPLIMEGEVVSLAPSFPESGVPTCRVRALNAFLRRLQKIRVEGNYDGTPKEVVDQLCREHEIPVDWALQGPEGAFEENVEVEGILYDEIARRTGAYGLKMMTKGSGDDLTLYLAKPNQSDEQPVADFIWGRTLISFAPALSAANQVAAVTCRGSNPNAKGADQNIEVTKGWGDVGLSPTALGPAAAANIETAVGGMVEVIKPDGVETVEDAERAALARLSELATTMITGTGKAIGLPDLRAGRTVTMAAMGARFDGIYRLTQTTHTIGDKGYTTTFQCRKEVLDA